MKYIQLSSGALVRVEAVTQLTPWWGPNDPANYWLYGSTTNWMIFSKQDYDTLYNAIECQEGII